jgi:predicted nucleic acid-binding protein
MTKAKNTVWVLTREINEYYQDGKYFVAVFATWPSIQELAQVLTNHTPRNLMEAVVLLEHIRAGGGRQKTEDIWFNLDEISFVENVA